MRSRSSPLYPNWLWSSSDKKRPAIAGVYRVSVDRRRYHKSNRVDWIAATGGRHVGTILIILLILLLIGAVPRWGYNRSWGYYPSGLLGLVLLIVIILVLTGRV